MTLMTVSTGMGDMMMGGQVWAVPRQACGRGVREGWPGCGWYRGPLLGAGEQPDACCEQGLPRKQCPGMVHHPGTLQQDWATVLQHQVHFQADVTAW